MKNIGGSPRTKSVFTKDWTKGSILGNLLSLSWPIMVNQSLNMVGPTIDMIWVGKLGAAPIAGVGIGGMAVMLVNSIMMGIIVGLRAIIARFAGAGDAGDANHVARQAFAVGAIFSIVMASIGIFFAESILIMFGLEADVVAEGAAYMRIMFVGSVAMSFRMVAEGIMQSSGDTVTPMKIAIAFRFLHAVLCPFLFFAWWIFPSLGVRGAALTNVISQCLGVTLGLWVLFSGRTRLWLNLDNFRLDPKIIWRIVRIGLPASIMGMQRNLGHLVLMWFMVPFGTLAVAAHTLCQRLDMLLVMVGIGLGNGAGVLVGQNLGAGQPERAARSGWLAAGVVEGFMVIGALAILLWADSIIGIFNSEPNLVELAGTFLRIAAAGYLMLGFGVTLSHSISGAGDTIPPMLVTLLTIWMVQMPLAFLLPKVTDLGIYGIRWAMVASMAVGAVTYTTYFRLGKWKHKQV